jgi:L-ascorbate metabolism protein UlaG (beta-lactamase superfamily)
MEFQRQIEITYVGGPTCLLEFGGVRFLTDPTFDPAGGEYTSGPVTLRKISGPALRTEALGSFDHVLLSHDHHSDNLDHAGRAILASAKMVFTTKPGAERLGGSSVGLEAWQSIEIPTPKQGLLRVVAVPARHGPEGRDRGSVTGFVLFFENAPKQTLYVSGDTVWYEGVAEIARRFSVQVAILHLGAARVPEVGPYHLTMTATEAVQTAREFANATIIPLHFEDWAHFSEGPKEIADAFREAQLEHRLRWPVRGRTIQIDSRVGRA